MNARTKPEAPLKAPGRSPRRPSRRRVRGGSVRELIAGNRTNGCVHYPFADGHQRDYHVRVLEDCAGGSDVRAHTAALEAMEYLQTGARRTSQEVLAAIRELVAA